MYGLSIVLLAFAPLLFSEGSYVDTMTKCSITDNECLKDSYQKFLIHAANGVPELDIPAIDPMRIENLNLTFLNALHLTIKDGVIKGIKSCVFKKFDVNLDKEWAASEFVCDALTLKGQFVLAGTSPGLQALFGNNPVNGQGKAITKLEKLTMTLELPVSVIKKEDGENYIIGDYSKIKHTYNLEKATFKVEKVVIGKEDISELVTNYMNENWKSLLNSFGKDIFKKAREILSSLTNKFFSFVPAKKYIIEDLSSYIKN